MANSVDPDQTAPIGVVCSGSMLFALIRNSSEMLGNYLQQTTSVDDIFRCIFFLGSLRVNNTPGTCPLGTLLTLIDPLARHVMLMTYLPILA